RVVILDFSIARDLLFPKNAPQEQEITGTAAYMSPEQAAAEPTTPAADWYAVGTVLYQALTGRLPFNGTFYEMLQNKIAHEPPPPDERVPNLPRALADLCVDLLRALPSERPGAAEILRRLGAELEDLGPSNQHALFVGRTDELAELARSFEMAARTRAITVV